MLGSNDAIISVSSLMINIGATDASKQTILITNITNLITNSISITIKKFVSVSAQRDSKQTNITHKTKKLTTSPNTKLHKLATIYHHHKLNKDLAMTIAKQLSAHNQLNTHLHNKLKIKTHTHTQPLQAAWISTVSFAAFALLPILNLLTTPTSLRLVAITIVTLISLNLLNLLNNQLNNTSINHTTLHVTFDNTLAMAITAGIGRLLSITKL